MIILDSSFEKSFYSCVPNPRKFVHNLENLNQIYSYVVFTFTMFLCISLNMPSLVCIFKMLLKQSRVHIDHTLLFD